jgi:hypothetical protein
MAKRAAALLVARFRQKRLRFAALGTVRVLRRRDVPLSPRKGDQMQRGMNVLALVKGSERYVFLYDDNSSPELLRTLGRFAADPQLSFTWYDAAILSQKVRRLRKDVELEREQQGFPGSTR